MTLERGRLGRVVGTALACALLVLSLAHVTALASIAPDFPQPAERRLAKPPYDILDSSTTLTTTRNSQFAIRNSQSFDYAQDRSAIHNSQFAIRNPRPLTLTLRLIPSPVAQGQALIILARASADVAVSGQLFGQSLTFAGNGRNHWALMGVAPWGETGLHRLTVEARDGQGRQVIRTALVSVVATEFAVENVNLLPGREELLDPATVAEEWKVLESIFRTVTPRQLWSGPFRLPVGSVVTSGFGTRHSFGGGPPRGYHTGLDLRGAVGTPVAAAEQGRIVLAEELTVRGKAVILDHGLGVHTGYYHLAAITVEPGEMVYKGQVIGQVGMTGLVSGPHLHWELRIREVPVDPLAFTLTTIPEPEQLWPQLRSHDP